MKRISIFCVFIAVFCLLLCGCIDSLQTSPATDISTDMEETLQKSLVYVEVTAYAYEQFQPWKQL